MIRDHKPRRIPYREHRPADAVHHRFGAFFGDPVLQTFITSVGGDPAPPEIIVAEAIASPDQF